MCHPFVTAQQIAFPMWSRCVTTFVREISWHHCHQSHTTDTANSQKGRSQLDRSWADRGGILGGISWETLCRLGDVYSQESWPLWYLLQCLRDRWYGKCSEQEILQLVILWMDNHSNSKRFSVFLRVVMELSGALLVPVHVCVPL